MAVTRPTFVELGIPEQLTKILHDNGITVPTPIQARTLPDSLAGRDVLGRGRTGSGKTYAFLLPLVARLAAADRGRSAGRPRALVLVPTRELATQVDASLRPLAAAVGLRSVTIFGGVGAAGQIAALRRGVDVVVACPGRLDDHVANGHAWLDAVEITVIDEADHMADMGFLPVVRRLLDRTPRQGQRMLFSATLDGDIDVLVKRYMHNPATHHVDAGSSPVGTMAHHTLEVRREHTLQVLVELAAAPGRSLIFTRTKHGAKKLTKQLHASGIAAVELHGNLKQSARDRNLRAFADGTSRTLVATDIAARGIHVDDVALVIHSEPPVEHKAYLHRSGRTARAGASGTVITLHTAEQTREVKDLVRRAGIKPRSAAIVPGDALLAKLAPGERRYEPVAPPAPVVAPRTTPAREGAPRRNGSGGGPAVAEPAPGARRSSRRRPARRAGTATTDPRANTPNNGATTRTSSAAAFSARSRLGR